MKYFISDDHWDVEGYCKQLSSLETRLSKRAFTFFSKHSFHDAFVKSFTINNGNWYFERRIENPTTIEAHLVDYINGFEYIVTWSGVVRFEFLFDAREKTYIGLDGKVHHYKKDTHGIANWGYDEITIHNKKYLSHEILLHSGATIILLFTDLDYKRGTKAS